MSVIIDGTSGVNTPNTFAFKNRLIDGGFIINQRGYVSGTALSSGTYAHDRWKAGSGGCTYTFTQGSLGVPTTITITAGSLQQVIEGCNMAEGGTYVLSWTGTAQARFNGGTYGSSPLSVTGITAGANTTIEFNTGTVSSAQLEVGSQATSFDYRPYGTELALCQRYYEKSYDQATVPNTATTTGQFNSGGVQGATTTTEINGGSLVFAVSKRATPTITVYDTNGISGKVNRVEYGVKNNFNSTGSPSDIGQTTFTVISSSGATASGLIYHWTASAEL